MVATHELTKQQPLVRGRDALNHDRREVADGTPDSRLVVATRGDGDVGARPDRPADPLRGQRDQPGRLQALQQVSAFASLESAGRTRPLE